MCDGIRGFNPYGRYNLLSFNSKPNFRARPGEDLWILCPKTNIERRLDAEDDMRHKLTCVPPDIDKRNRIPQEHLLKLILTLHAVNRFFLQYS